MTASLVIAVDGPSGAGKSTTSRGVACRLGLAYLDTGAMYRAIQVAAMRAGVAEDKDAIADLVDHTVLTVSIDPANPTISIDGVDVSEEIRSPEVSRLVSNAATTQHVRDVLTAQMRNLIKESGARIVVEGRDITTKVWPDAELRLLLTAEPEIRVSRRQAELDSSLSRAEVADQVIRRDRDDSSMSQFMTAAGGVTTIDTSQLTLAQVIDLVCSRIETLGQ